MRAFIEELRHRNVFRVGIAYVITGWLLAQVADLVVDAFNLPDAFLQMVIILLVFGFPVSLFFAWAFELTPDGVKKAKDLPADMPKDPRSGKQLNRLTIVTLLFAVAWLGWDKLQDPAEAPAPETAVTDKSIAVLPFADFSPGGDQAWFADGLTDEILNALARARDLRVASRTSSFGYRGTELDIPTLAAELNVAHVLEGSVRRAGDRIRVTAQLIRASDDAHLWSETFDASSDDSIEIQEEIAFEIASLLDTAMDPEELRRMVAAGTESIAAWEGYIRMRELLYRSWDEFDTSIANVGMQELYNEVVAEDPEFAEAHLLFAEIVFGWVDPGDSSWGPPDLSYDAKRALLADVSAKAARYARSDDARLGAEILRARVQMRLVDLVDLTAARLALDPNSRELWSEHLGTLFLTSQFDEARALGREFAAHDFGDGQIDSEFYPYIARIDIEPGLAGAEAAVSVASPTPANLYQAHRVFLFADRVGEAAQLARRYKSVATDETWGLLVDLRQACAEGRVADADKRYAEFDFSGIAVSDNNIQWLALQTLGRNDEAVALLRPLDQESTLYALASLLVYMHFDPRPFPNLSAALEAQGVMRDTAMPLNFACRR